VDVEVEIRTPNEKNDEDQSEATDWIISDFSEEEAMARPSFSQLVLSVFLHLRRGDRRSSRSLRVQLGKVVNRSYFLEKIFKVFASQRLIACLFGRKIIPHCLLKAMWSGRSHWLFASGLFLRRP
jgi:hypothetical protein